MTKQEFKRVVNAMADKMFHEFITRTINHVNRPPWDCGRSHVATPKPIPHPFWRD